MMIGLTGGSGSGKSTVAKLFERRGFYHLDTDGVVHGLVYPDPRFVAAVCREFGAEYVKNGAVDRRALARLVFSDRERYDKLMSVIVPFIMRRLDELIDAHADENVVIDAPLLFQYGLDKACDATVGVVSKNALSRICERDGISEDEARARLSNQPDEKYYRDRCTYIIENDGGLSELAEKTDAVIDKLL